MRSFSQIQRDRKLFEFVDPPEGTLYLGKATDGEPAIVVRHFDGTLPVSRLGTYVELVRQVQEWIAARPKLSALVRVEQPVEVGSDFVARPHHVYYTRTRSYVDDEDPPTPPPELSQMRESFRALRATVENPSDELLYAILARSVVEPSGKTFFEDDENRFIIVEPKITPDDLARWDDLAEEIAP